MSQLLAEEIELAVTLSREAEEHAAKLIRAGKTTPAGEWDGPSAEAENQYIEANGLEAYATWFLGRQSEVAPDAKGHYNFPFSQDFKTVHRRGLIAIRSRAAQFDDKSIFDAAGRLLELYSAEEEPEDYAARRTKKLLRISFQRRLRSVRGRYKVDKGRGFMTDVSLIQVGEAKGHAMYIDEASLDSGLEVLGNGTLPAYVTHEDAMDDRLLKEIGVFSGFYVEEGKLKAESFEALASFKSDEPEKYRRLFDVAEAMPDAFGLSLVFEADLVWITSDGAEVSISEGKPKDALRDLPAVRFQNIRSADFVDAPAANESGLFSERKNITSPEALKMATEETDKATDIDPVEEQNETPHEETVEEAVEAQEPDAEVAAEEGGEEVAEEAAEESAEELSEVETLSKQIEELTAKVAALTADLEAALEKNKTLSALVQGEEALEEGDESTPTQTILDQFNTARGADQTRLWKQNKEQILRSARG